MAQCLHAQDAFLEGGDRDIRTSVKNSVVAVDTHQDLVAGVEFTQLTDQLSVVKPYEVEGGLDLDCALEGLLHATLNEVLEHASVDRVMLVVYLGL